MLLSSEQNKKNTLKTQPPSAAETADEAVAKSRRTWLRLDFCIPRFWVLGELYVSVTTLSLLWSTSRIRTRIDNQARRIFTKHHLIHLTYCLKQLFRPWSSGIQITDSCDSCVSTSMRNSDTPTRFSTSCQGPWTQPLYWKIFSKHLSSACSVLQEGYILDDTDPEGKVVSNYLLIRFWPPCSKQ